MKVLFPLIAVLMAAFMAASCGGGGVTNDGNLSGLQPIPGATVVKTDPVDTSYVNAYIASATGLLNVAGHAGAATPNATVRIANGTGEFTLVANADGSFHNYGVLPPGFTCSSGESIEIYQTVQSCAESDPAVAIVN